MRSKDATTRCSACWSSHSSWHCRLSRACRQNYQPCRRLGGGILSRAGRDGAASGSDLVLRAAAHRKRISGIAVSVVRARRRGSDSGGDTRIAFTGILGVAAGLDACAMIGRGAVALCLSAWRAQLWRWRSASSASSGPSVTGPGVSALPVSSIGAFACAAAVATIIAVGSSPTPQILERRLHRLVIAPQVLIPGLFFILLPTPWMVEGNRVFGQPITTAAWIAIGAFILLAYADLYRCIRQLRRAAPGGLGAAVSPLCLIAILLFVKVLPTEAGSIRATIITSGNTSSTWWTWRARPLRAILGLRAVARLVNYLPGALGALVSDGTATGMGIFAPYRTASFLLLAFPPIAMR